MDIPL